MKVGVRFWVPWLALVVACSAGPDERVGPEASVQPLAVQVQVQAGALASSRSEAPRLSRQELLARLEARLARPAKGLRMQTGPDGTRRIALDGHLQHATIAVVGPDGSVRTSCVDGPAAAAHALGVEPLTSTP
jgi:hypothetical protein